MAEEESKSTEITSKSGKTISEKNVAYKVFLQNYTSLTKLLFNTNLTPHLIQGEVIVPRDQEELNAIPTSAGKAEFVLLKVSSALETGETGTFQKILEIMKFYGNGAAQQLSTNIEYEIAGSQKGTEPVTDKTIDIMSLEFSALVADIAEILDKSANLKKFKLFCCSITTSEKSLVFSDKESAAIRACNSVYDVFYELRDHWRWDSHRLLFTLIKRTGSQDAMERFKQFENKKVFATKLKNLTDYFQSINKPPPRGYTRMTAILEKDYADFSLDDCKELEEYIANFFGSDSEALNPGHWNKSNSIKVTWYIPTGAVSRLLSKAHQAKEIYQLLSISFFEIDEIVVWNKMWPYSLQAIQDSKSETKHRLKEFEDESLKLGKQVKSLTEQLKEKEALIIELQQTTDEKDQKIRALSTEKAKLEGESGFESMKESIDQAGKPMSKESSADIEDINKNMAIFKLETELDEQAKSFTATLEAKDAEMDKIQSELKKKSEELQKLQAENMQMKSEAKKLQAENMQMKSEAKIKDDQVKGQKKESYHTIKMKYDELQVKYRQNDIHIQHLKKNLDEAENKITSLKKVIDANENRPKESDRAASEDLEEKTNQMDSFQRQLKDLEDQNRSLQEKLENEKANVKANELKESEAAQRLEEKAKQIDSLQQALHQVQNENRSLQEKTKKHMQSQGDTSTLRLQNSELSTQVTRLRAEVSQMKINYSQLDNDSKKLKEQIKTLHNKEQQQQQLMEKVREANSNVDAMKKEISDQAKSYTGTIDEKDDIIAKLQSELKKSEKQQLECEKACKQMETEISKLKAEIQKIKKPRSADLGYHSGQLAILPDDQPSQLTLSEQELIKQVREANSNIEAMKKEISDQAISYTGTIDEKDDIIAKLQSDLKKSKNKQLEIEKACKQMENEISKLKAESQKIKKPRSTDSGYHSRQLDTLPDDPPSQPTLTQHQIGAQISEAASNSKAIIEELNDQVQSYLGLLNENDDRIKKLQDENKRLREEKVQASKPQVERRQQKDDKEKERARTWKRGETMSMYLSSSDDSELQQIFKKWRAADKDNQ